VAVKNVSLTLLLPPSEGKAAGGASGTSWQAASGRFAAELGRQRAEVAAALAALGGGDARLLGVSGTHLERARAANAALLGAPTLPASERYTGVVWDAIDLASMRAPVRRRASGAVLVVSGLLGVVGLDDPTPDYRLKMGAALAPFGKLSSWWRPAVSAAITASTQRRYVVDLLPNEHRAAWEPDERTEGVRVGFVERSGKVAGHDAKAAKGRLARFLLESRGHPLDLLDLWRDERFDLTITSL
jgi:cytoplasmic iron level regulating protein YaaA (DUF328/UPF0246 family)